MEIFNAGCEMTRPYTCGKNICEFTNEEFDVLTVQLTDEEKQSEFAKHYYEPMAEIEETHEQAIKYGAISAEQCFMPEQAGEIILSKDKKYPENGYGVMHNGIGFARILIHQDGITDDMIKKYREEFAHDEKIRNLFYKIWFPSMHLIHFDDAVIENFGWGLVIQEMNWERFRFSHVGLTKEYIQKKDPDCIYFLGLGGMASEFKNPNREPWPTFMLATSRKTDKGRELTVVYWSGLTLNSDGTITCKINPDYKQTEKEMGMMMEHCMREYCNELKLIKNFWNQDN